MTEPGERTPAETPLLLDAMLGKLARYLRMCGFDTAYVMDGGSTGEEEESTNPPTSPSDETICEWAHTTGRMLLTRDAELAERVCNQSAITLTGPRESGTNSVESGSDPSGAGTDPSKTGDRVLLLTSKTIEEQLRELAAQGFVLELPNEPVRCGTCNGRLVRVDPDQPTPEYAPPPRETPCWRCEDCGQYFWQGSHWDDVAAALARLS